MKALNHIREMARQDPKRIVLCEGDDPRVLRAALTASAAGYARIQLVGEHKVIQSRPKPKGLSWMR